jgi:CTP synthase (UTP-ammonia lyase)
VFSWYSHAPFLLTLNGKLGGTVGDIESAPFVEAMRQFQFRVGHENFALIHVSLVPDMHGEQKTKPTQTTVHALRGLGLLPDLVRPLYQVSPFIHIWLLD